MNLVVDKDLVDGMMLSGALMEPTHHVRAEVCDAPDAGRLRFWMMALLVLLAAVA